jgi:hypothetical protein
VFIRGYQTKTKRNAGTDRAKNAAHQSRFGLIARPNKEPGVMAIFDIE